MMFFNPTKVSDIYQSRARLIMSSVTSLCPFLCLSCANAQLTGNDRLFQVTVGAGYFYITHDGGGNKPEFYLVAGSTDTGTGGSSLSINVW